jgi:hypothetical protein
MRLRIICEDAARLAWLNKILLPMIPDEARRMQAAATLLDADPTKAKKLAQWLGRLTTNGIISIRGIIAARPNTQIRLPEDSQRVQDALALYERSKPRIPVANRDLNRFNDFYALEDMLNGLVNQGAVQATATKVREVPGAEIISAPPYTIYKVERVSKDKTKFTPEELVRVKAIETLGMGPPETKWCTRARYSASFGSYAARYLCGNDMFVVYKDGQPFLQKAGKQVMDVNDRPITPPPEIINILSQLQKRANAAKKAVALQRVQPFIEQIETGQLAKVVVITSSGAAIGDRIVDAGSYYYICAEPGLHRGRITNPTPQKAAIIRNNNLAVTMEGTRRPLWLYKHIITVNKVNVEKIIGRDNPLPANHPVLAEIPRTRQEYHQWLRKVGLSRSGMGGVQRAPAPQINQPVAPAPAAQPGVLQRIGNLFGR